MWCVINSLPFLDGIVNKFSGCNYHAVTDKVVHVYEI